LCQAPENVWDINCSSFFPDTIAGMDIHSAYFETEGTLSLIRDVLRGLDRKVLKTLDRLEGDVWPPHAPA
jgi:hypothetical protein